ncbi:MAG: hypothetical protein K2N88_01320 [Muribaculaceae bacterium]|nr:hypothetical protein [Muribaculaceae bacterium]
METKKYTTGNLRLIIHKLLVEKRKTLLYAICGFLGAWMVIGIWSGCIIGGEIGGGTTFGYIALSTLICTVAASFTFADLKTKEGRISFLMTPGSAAAKYLPRVAACVFGTIIICFIGYYFYIASIIITQGLVTGTWLPFFTDANTFTLNYEGIILLAAIIAGFFFTEGVYVLGSAIWPKKSFIKTTGIFLLLQFVLSIITAFVVSHCKFKLYWFASYGEALIWSVIGLVFLIDFALFYIAYCRIKRITLI